MHDYLRAVGFSKVQHKRDLQRLLDMVMGSPDSEFASDCGGTVYAEKCRDFVSNAGITVRGEVDEHGMFSYEYYFPHYTGHQISLTDDVSVEKVHDILEEQKKRGAVIIIACHDKEELEMLSDEIIEIYEGRIVAQEKV